MTDGYCDSGLLHTTVIITNTSHVRHDSNYNDNYWRQSEKTPGVGLRDLVVRPGGSALTGQGEAALRSGLWAQHITTFPPSWRPTERTKYYQHKPEVLNVSTFQYKARKIHLRMTINIVTKLIC